MSQEHSPPAGAPGVSLLRITSASEATANYVAAMNQDRSVAAGERTLIARRRFSSIPLVFDIEVASVDDNPPTGTLERVGSRWIFGRTRTLVPLGARNRVAKGFWDTFFDVYIIPDRPVQVTMGRTRTSNRVNLGVLAAIVLVIALAIYYVASTS